MRRVLLSVLLVLAALVLQLTVLDRAPLPGGVAPDLVLLVVVALALSSGPMPGLITGFCAGLALDIAPPANHLIGVYALVFCLVGYCCGLVSAELDSSVLLPLAASALGAAGGAALYAVVGVFLGNPDVTGQSVRHVLPLSVLYDVLLSPFILYGVALASRLASRLSGAAEGAGELASGASWQAGGQQAGSSSPKRQAGRTPRIRAAAARQRDGWIGGGGWLAASAELARSRPSTVRLHLGGKRGGGSPAQGRAASARAASARAASGAGGSGAGRGLARMRFGAGHRGDGVVGGRLLGGGFFSGLTNSGRGMLRPASGPRLFTRRTRTATTRSLSARFSRRPAWGIRSAGGAGSAGGTAPRRGSFSASSPRKGPASAATPRRGTFTATSQRRRTPSTGSPRRGAFSGGSSTKGTFGSGSPRRGAFGKGPLRLRTLRRATLRGGSPARSRSAIGRVRGGRSSPWRIGHKRNGGYR